MSTFSIKIGEFKENQKAVARGSDNLLHPIHIVADGQCFPSESWKDFPIIILAWWLGGYREMLQNRQKIENSFMNGPYEFFTEITACNELSISFFKHTITHSLEIIPGIVVPIDHYQNQLRIAAINVIASAEHTSEPSRDMQELMRCLKFSAS